MILHFIGLQSCQILFNYTSIKQHKVLQSIFSLPRCLCAGMFTVLKLAPISNQVNDYTDLLLICVLF